MRPSVLIYRDQLLPYSETFVRTQVEHLRRYQGVYVGTSRPAKGLELPAERQLCLSDYTRRDTLWRGALKLGGVVHPGWGRAMAARQSALIHAHFGLDGLWAAVLSRRLGRPFVITFRGNDITGMQFSRPQSPRPHLRDLRRHQGTYFCDYYVQQRPRLFHQAARCIAVSEFIRERLVQAGCPPENIQVVYDGVDASQFAPDPQRPREPVVLCVGRLVEKKGGTYLIEAMARVQAQRPDLRLVFIGDGPLRSQLQRQAQSQLRHCEFLGVRSHAEVKEWMVRSQLVAVPSVTAASGDSEGLPCVAVEAIAAGVPVVGTRHAGIPDAVIHQHTGWLTAEKDVDGLAEGILRLSSDQALWQHCARAARQHALDRFTIEANVQHLEALYDGVTAHE